MIDADELTKMNKEQYITFINRRDIVPIVDNKIKYDNVVYEMNDFEMKALIGFRETFGYDRHYHGLERKPGEAEIINGMLQSGIDSIVSDIKYENKNRIKRHKILFKEIK